MVVARKELLYPLPIDNLPEPLWLRKPTLGEGYLFDSPVFVKARETPDKLTPAELEEVGDAVYKLMAEIIMVPKMPADFWKKNSDVSLQAAFTRKCYELMGLKVLPPFLEPAKQKG